MMMKEIVKKSIANSELQACNSGMVLKYFQSCRPATLNWLALVFVSMRFLNDSELSTLFRLVLSTTKSSRVFNRSSSSSGSSSSSTNRAGAACVLTVWASGWLLKSAMSIDMGGSAAGVVALAGGAVATVRGIAAALARTRCARAAKRSAAGPPTGSKKKAPYGFNCCCCCCCCCC